MPKVDFITALHKSSPRDYLSRVARGDKAHCAEVAKGFGKDYWDGDRKYGYGGFVYDGRWQPVARAIIEHYGFKPGNSVLDVGCGKAFLIHDMMQALPGLEVRGIDSAAYALEQAKDEVKPFLEAGRAQELPYADNSFDLVISLSTLHNLYLPDLVMALREIERVSRGNSYITVESYRNETEKANLLNWQLTCECVFTPAEWEWIFAEYGYSGDYTFTFFE